MTRDKARNYVRAYKHPANRRRWAVELVIDHQSFQLAAGGSPLTKAEAGWWMDQVTAALMRLKLREPKMKLINGPYDGGEIEDSGTVAIKMEVAERWPQREGDKCGYAIYEPNAARSCAFWLDTVWDGTHVETIR